MTKGLTRSLSRGPVLQQPVTKKTFTARSLAVTVDGATGAGFGSAVLGGLPQGNLMLLGAVSYLKFSGPSGGSAGLVDTWNGDYGVGSTPASDATITAGDVDIVPSTAVGPAVSEVSPITRGVQADGAFCGVVLDNTAGDLELNVNLLVDDADISADGIAMTIDGELHIAYVMLGDD